MIEQERCFNLVAERLEGIVMDLRLRGKGCPWHW